MFLAALTRDRDDDPVRMNGTSCAGGPTRQRGHREWHWLRRAIYLGNENYPWFQKNPAWNNLHTNADFERILEDLKKGFRKNQKTWKRLLEQVPPSGE